ncbi:hypothetical protein BegalDRAFT_3303 [Beggiatoa alba B18LD]|uniref:Uncharacterized protein n=1 Tax=Beggiatoa alba B18LD TaxID=395493 RepID=I3CKH9_9GAMM|nr:hypothetical protein [Beggiatoa alba]EIJ44122.1 hypothetical protein BegalDRAFT_3303 [Beggiatoa alba B18LD]
MIKYVTKKSDPTQRYLVVFHTQEARDEKLSMPLKCRRSDAWLGEGFYFWLEEEFAHYWGSDSKKPIYCIYKGYLLDKNILDATFSSKGYFLFVQHIDKAIEHIKRTYGRSPSLAEVHAYLADKIWHGLNIKGIIYDDLPKNSRSGERIYSEIKPLYYKKRIQLVLFDLDILEKFEIYQDNQEVKENE